MTAAKNYRERRAGFSKRGTAIWIFGIAMIWFLLAAAGLRAQTVASISGGVTDRAAQVWRAQRLR